MNRKLIPITIELVGIATIGVGIGVELATHADIGWATSNNRKLPGRCRRRHLG